MDEDATWRPEAAPLRAELARWPFLVQAWRDQPADSRLSYDSWVLSSRSAAQARRRASAVTRRLYTGRPWADQPTRALQGVRDAFTQAPDLGPGSDGTGPPG